MNKILVALLLVVSFVTFASAQKIDMMGGLNLSYNMVSYGASQGDYSMSASMNFLGIGAFIDAMYARLTISYAMSMGGMSTTVKMGGESETVSESGYAENYLILDLIGKYPIEADKGIIVWPAAGFLYDMFLGATLDGSEVEYSDDAKADKNDFYLKFGVGADFAVAENIVVTPAIFYALNLTAKPKDVPSDVN